MSTAAKRFTRQFEQLHDKAAETEALDLKAQAAQAEREARELYAANLARKVERVRRKDDFIGSLSQALLHFYGTKIDSEVLGTLAHGDEEEKDQLEALFEAATKIGREKQPTPIFVKSPQRYTFYREPPVELTHLQLVLVDPKKPFFASRNVRPDVLMHAFTGQRADVLVRSLGFAGLAFVATSESAGACRYAHAQNPALIESEGRADGTTSSGMSEYAYSGKHENLVFSDRHDPTYTVGWEEIDKLTANTDTPARRSMARCLLQLAEEAGYEDLVHAESVYSGS